jgi:hypothetical protein
MEQDVAPDDPLNLPAAQLVQEPAVPMTPE